MSKKTNPKIALGQSVAKGDTPKALWEYTDEELSNLRVTDSSMFTDNVWVREDTTPGQDGSRGRLNWTLKLLDGTHLTDPQHARRLMWGKKLMAALLLAPSDGIGPGVGSTPGLRIGFIKLISWMSEQGYHYPHELTPDVVNYYIEDLPRFILDHQEDEEISWDTVVKSMLILKALWAERSVLNKWGVRTLTAPPNSDHQRGFVSRIVTKARGWIQPLPDEVAIPIFNKAAWFLGVPADDVVKLLDCLDAPPLAGEYLYTRTVRGKKVVSRKAPGKAERVRARRTNRFLANFKFSRIPGESLPWHQPIDEDYVTTSGISAAKRVKELFFAVREACTITIQGTTGMRISELVGIKAGEEPTTGLPFGVRIENSATGLYEVFIIRTVLAKTVKGLPRDMDWVLGMRPAGSADEPLALRALRVLHRLHAPWRETSRSDRLILSGKGGIGLPRPTTSLSAMTTDLQNFHMKNFIERWVDLSDLPDESKHKIKENDLVLWRESKGRIFISHMLRKTWAQFVFAVDPALVPAIKLQFHHLSLAMTDTGYIGSNPLLMQSMNQVAEQQRNLLIFETVMGRAPLAGKMGGQIEQATRELAKEIKDLPVSDAWEHIIEFCENHGLKIFFSPYATCLPVHTSRMRCHDEAHTPVGLRFQPNYNTREPSLCAGCDNFVMDYRHIPFWKDRYLQNWITYKKAEQRDATRNGQFRVFLDRADQARKLLKKAGADIKELERQVAKALEDQHDTF